MRRERFRYLSFCNIYFSIILLKYITNFCSCKEVSAAPLLSLHFSLFSLHSICIYPATTALAMAEMHRPRPSSCMPSVVVAFRETCSREIPRSSAIFSRMFWK